MSSSGQIAIIEPRLSIVGQQISSSLKALGSLLRRIVKPAARNGRSSTEDFATTSLGITKTIQRLEESPHYSPSSSAVAPYGYFYDRPIIGDSGPILGGIYLSVKAVEALVVDEKYGILLNCYHEICEHFRTIPSESLDELRCLQEVLGYATEKLANNSREISRIHATIEVKQDQKVALDTYIQAGVGAVRHQALLAGYLIENLKRNGHLDGTVSLDTSNSSERVIYRSPTGDVHVLNFEARVVESGQ